MNLKDKLKEMSEEEQLKLSCHRRNAGKRPLVVWRGFCFDRIPRKGMGRKNALRFRQDD